jgi:predicted MFS family arabinose efflux permease
MRLENMSDVSESRKEPAQTINNLGILSLILSKGITNLPSLVVSLLLVDIATTFNVQVGVAGQIRTTSGLLSILFAILMGVLSMRYSHKWLLAWGLILYIVSAVTSYFSTSLLMLLMFFALSGVATSMVNPMINTLIGRLVAPGKRVDVMGWTVAGLSLIYLAGSLSIGYISPWGWRTVMVLVVVPMTIINLFLFTSQVPHDKAEPKSGASIASLLEGYRALLRSRSAIGCIIGTMLSLAMWNALLVYAPSYWRQVFNVPTTTTATYYIFTSLSYMAGSLLVGRFTKRIGIRRLLLYTTGALGVITLFCYNAPSILIGVVLGMVASFFAGMLITLASIFSLEQIPEYRGTMMSIHAAATSLGATLAAAVGGFILVTYSYGIYSIAMGIIGIVGALIYMFMTNEPKR